VPPSKRHRGGKQSPKGTGRPDPNKDRSQHEGSRGVPIQTIADLSRERPTEDELTNYTALLSSESDRGAAIMGCALVEQTLELAIRSRLVDPGDTITRQWFEGPNAPFGTFSAKIKLGRALGIFAEEMDGRLTLLKDIRNAFAHTSRPIDFNHPSLAVCRQKLAPDPEKVADKMVRAVFSASCIAVSKILAENAFEHGGKEIEVDIP